MAESSPTDPAALIVMARYPEPGRCKTRLIPALGPDGAARLHADLTVHTLTWARELRDRHGVSVHVIASVASPQQMAERFGKDLHYLPQCGEDLGQRMKAAVKRISQDGARRIVIVGTDCPQLGSRFVWSAIESLADHSVCLSPALDGGYVLVGFRLAPPEDAACGAPSDGGVPRGCPTEERLLNTLFDGITWGTEQVWNQTIAALSRLPPLAVRLLEPHCDVDYPEDLPVWEQAREQSCGSGNDSPRLSVIIPIGGKERRLEQAMQSALAADGVEVILVAAEPLPDLLPVAGRNRAQHLIVRGWRGKCVDVAIQQARADQLLVLHADTILPPNYIEQVEAILARRDVAVGAFHLAIDSNRWMARIIERGVALRCRWLGMPYGDQALFFRRELWQQAGGIRDLPIMEDYEMVRRFSRYGRVEVAPSSVVTSARRWHDRGFWRTTLTNQLVVFLYHCGVAPGRLAQIYRRAGKTRPPRQT